MSSHYYPRDKSRRINAAPNNIIRDSTGARIGVQNRDGSMTPLTSNLGRPLGAFHQSRADKILAARVNGSFHQKRDAFNSASKDQYMDEEGNIAARPTPAPAPGAAAAPADRPDPANPARPPAPSAADVAPSAKPAAKITETMLRERVQAHSDLKSGITHRDDNVVEFFNRRLDKDGQPTGKAGTATIYGQREGGDRRLVSSAGTGMFHGDGGKGPSMIEGRPAQEFFSNQARTQNAPNRFAKADGTPVTPGTAVVKGGAAPMKAPAPLAAATATTQRTGSPGLFDQSYALKQPGIQAGAPRINAPVKPMALAGNNNNNNTHTQRPASAPLQPATPMGGQPPLKKKPEDQFMA